MTDRATFLSAILAEPLNDQLRLVFCDWLEENGDGERAEFIRTQLELAQIGEPRVLLGGKDDAHARVDSLSEINVRHVHLTSRGGPDYYEADSSLDAPVGSRVDVQTAEWSRAKHCWTKKITHGLLVRKVDSGPINKYTLKQDEHSSPFPAKRHKKLSAREAELLAAHRREWVAEGLPNDWCASWSNGWVCTESGFDGSKLCNGPASHIHYTFSRGFISRVRCRWEEWQAHHAELRAAWPIEKVELTTLTIIPWILTVNRGRFAVGTVGGMLDRFPLFCKEEFGEGIEFTLPAEAQAATPPRHFNTRCSLTPI